MDPLRYLVPNGLDVGVLVSTLHQEGYAAEGQVVPEGHVLVVQCPGDADRDRAEVRRILEQATGPDAAYQRPTPDDVRFLDE